MEATYWYRQSLRRCAGDSLLYLGDAYLNGDGATRDTRTGFQLARFASALGATRATDLVRNMLRQGQSIPLAPPALADRYQTRQ
jgi:TPR repeat protein